MEFELKITNDLWNDKLSDSNSAAFFKLKKNLEEQFNKAFCDEPDTTVSQVTDPCRTEVTGFSEGSINVFFSLIRTELKQFLRGVSQLLAEVKQAISEIGGFIGGFEIDKDSVKTSMYYHLYSNFLKPRPC